MLNSKHQKYVWRLFSKMGVRSAVELLRPLLSEPVPRSLLTPERRCKEAFAINSLHSSGARKPSITVTCGSVSRMPWNATVRGTVSKHTSMSECLPSLKLRSRAAAAATAGLLPSYAEVLLRMLLSDEAAARLDGAQLVGCVRALEWVLMYSVLSVLAQ